MKIVNKKLTLDEFRKYVKKKDFGSLPPTFLCLHHTWKPTEKDWNGQKTIDGLKRYYEGKGWSAGPHLFIAPDGIWLFTDMYDVGIHAGEGNGSLKTGYSIGIEVVGNYDGAKWTGVIKEQTLGVIDCLLEKLKIPESKITFHSDFSSKTCPGAAIKKPWVIEQLHKYRDAQKEPVVIKKEEPSPTPQEPVKTQPEPISSVPDPFQGYEPTPHTPITTPVDNTASQIGDFVLYLINKIKQWLHR